MNRLASFFAFLLVAFFSFFSSCYHGEPIESINASTTSNSTITSSTTSSTLTSTPVILQLVKAESISNTQVKAKFNKALDADTSQQTANYAIKDLMIFLVAKVDDEPDAVLLTTTQQDAITYTLVVTNVQDTEGQTIHNAYNYSSFTGLPPSDTTAPKLVAAASIYTQQVRLEFSEPINPDTISNVQSYSIIGTQGTLVEKLSVLSANSSLTNPTLIILETDSQKVIEYTVTVSKVFGADGNEVVAPDNTKVFQGTVIGDTTPPDLDSVRAIDNRTVELIFSEKVDSNAAENPANYSIPGLTIVSAILTDSTAMVVHLITSSQQLIEYTVTVTGVTDRSNNSINDSDFNYGPFVGIDSDPPPPHFTGVIPLTNTTIQIKFDQPMETSSAQNPAHYTIAGLTVDQAVQDPDHKEVIVLTTSSQSDTSYTVNVEGLKSDLNVLMENVETRDFWGDANPCIASIIVKDNITLLVSFSETVEVTTATTTDNYGISSPDLIVNGATLDDTVGNIVTLSTSQQVAGIPYLLSVSNIQDNHGNTITVSDPACSQVSFSGSTVGDVVPPVIDAVIVSSTHSLLVSFSEIVDEASAENLVNYSIDNGINVLDIVLDPVNKKQVMITTDEMSELTYTITFSNIVDLTLINALNDSRTFVGDGLPRLISGVSLSYNEVELTFNENLAAGTAEISGNYSISGLSVGAAVINTLDPKKVKLFTSNQIQGNSYTVVVSNVQDNTGNVISPLFNQISIIGDGYPRLLSASAVDSTHIQLNFSEPLETISAETALNYTISGLTVVASQQNIGDGSIIVLQTSVQTQGSSYLITVLSSVEDSTGNNPMAPDHQASVLGDGNPEMLSVIPTDIIHVEAYFNEDVDLTTANIPGNYSITGLSVSNATRDAVDFKKVVLVTAPQVQSVSYTLTVTNVQDTTQNTIQAPDNTANFTGNGSPVLISISVINNRTIVLTFNETVDEITAETIGNYSINLLTVESATFDPGAPDKVTLRISAPTLATLYTVTVTNVEDSDGNAIQPPDHQQTFTGIEGVLYGAHYVSTNTWHRWNNANSANGADAPDAQFQGTAAAGEDGKIDTQRDIFYGINYAINKVFVWTSASTAGNIGATRSFDSVGFVQPEAVWIDMANDRLYAATTAGTQAIWVYYNASTLSNTVTPDRKITNTAINGIFGLAVDTTRDILYAANCTARNILVWESASTINGNVAPTRTITYTNQQFATIDVDPTNNRIYLSANGSNFIYVFNSASAISGEVLPTRTINGGLSGPYGVDYEPINDLLFVANYSGGNIKVYTNASTISGVVAATRTLTFASAAGVSVDMTR